MQPLTSSILYVIVPPAQPLPPPSAPPLSAPSPSAASSVQYISAPSILSVPHTSASSSASPKLQKALNPFAPSFSISPKAPNYNPSLPNHIRTKTPRLTILKSLHAGSLGCAPTPNQYFALAVSSLISLTGFPSPKGGSLGTGS